MYNIEIKTDTELIQTKIDNLEELEQILEEHKDYESVYAKEEKEK